MNRLTGPALIDFVENGNNVNARFVSSGPKSGYTVLHIAVMENRENIVRKLIINHRANINLVGADGAQPLHLAILFRSNEIATTLLDFGADVDAKLTNKLVKKYTSESHKWYDNFGGKMTLLTFVVINKAISLVEILLKYKANFRIKDINNRTLLMYAVESDSVISVENLAIKMLEYRPELINARDNDGLHAIHYLLHYKKFGEFRYDEDICFKKTQGRIAQMLLYAGADINATVHGDPDTQILNMAAYRCCYFLLWLLLDFNLSAKTKAEPLRYVMLPVYPKKFVRDSDENNRNLIEKIKKRRNECIELILKNLILRRSFRLFVPEGELTLMDRLVATDPEIKKVVSDYEKNFIDRCMKKKKIRYRDKYITFFDLAVKVFNDISLKSLVKNDELVEAYLKFYANERDHGNLSKVMHSKIIKVYKRRKLMKKVEKISGLRKFIPLPYEIILIIIEYLHDNNLKKFINAFYQNSIC